MTSNWIGRRSGVVVSSVLALVVAGCDVEVKDPGRPPDVDVEVTPGRAPDADIHGPDVDVRTEKREVTVPDVDVEVRPERKTIEVPDVDVTIPRDKDSTTEPDGKPD
jgi:hypothetical protein